MHQPFNAVDRIDFKVFYAIADFHVYFITSAFPLITVWMDCNILHTLQCMLKVDLCS